MARKRSELPTDRRNALRNAILGLLGEGEANAKPLNALESALRSDPQWKDLLRLRFVEEVGRLRAEGLIVAKRRVGYWKAATMGAVPATKETIEERAAEEVPVQKSKERDYYPALKAWLEVRYRCYAEDVSERGKRGRRRGGQRLVAVPDVVGVRYFPAPARDHLELVAIEAKVGRPSSADLSEAYRYSRFADLCYVAYDEDSLSNGEMKSELLEEATRLGLGVIQFPTRRGPGKRIVELQAPLQQQPDSLAKDEYLSEKLDIWQCVRCGTYHFVEDENDLTQTPRSEQWAGVITGENLEADRFICASCGKKL